MKLLHNDKGSVSKWKVKLSLGTEEGQEMLSKTALITFHFLTTSKDIQRTMFVLSNI
jgi:hypothetical protein